MTDASKLLTRERGTTPRPVFCITAEVHNDRALAEAVCRGRFTHMGVTLELGTEPDWLGAELPADEEWRIEWTKFYYGLDLSGAYIDTGDERFLQAWERLVASWIRQVGVGVDASDVAARRMQNWTYAWSRFTATPGFPGLRDGLEADLLLSLEGHASYVLDRLTPDVARNHRTLELYALFIVALALPQLDPRRELLDFTIAELHHTLREGFWPDGVHRENSSHYHLVVLRSLLGARENTRRFDLQLPVGFDADLERACEFALHCHRPDGYIPALSDADSAAYPEVLRLAACLLDRPDFRFAVSAGLEGTPPRRRYVSFPFGGYFVQRSGWGTDGTPFADERWLIFDCGPLGEGGHGHYDALAVEMYAHGRPLIVDPGRYTYSEETENLRHWFKGTSAHNTVCVDGLDQTPYRRGRPGTEVASASFGGRRSVAGLDVMEGCVESPCYDARHSRRVLFVADEYWIVDDRMEADERHRYDLRWHLAPDAWERTFLTVTGRQTVARAPGLVLVIAGGEEVRLEPGWVSPRYGIKHAAPIISVSAQASDARFVTLLAPVRAGRPVPALRLCDLPMDGPVTAEIEGAGESGGSDFVGWGGSEESLALGSVRCKADAAWLRRSPGGRAISFAGFGVTEVGTELAGIGVGERVSWRAGDVGKRERGR